MGNVRSCNVRYTSSLGVVVCKFNWGKVKSEVNKVDFEVAFLITKHQCWIRQCILSCYLLYQRVVNWNWQKPVVGHIVISVAETFFSPSLFDFLLHKLRRDADCVLSICYRSIHRRCVNFLPTQEEPSKFGDEAERLEPFIQFNSIRCHVLHCDTLNTADINNPPILVLERRLLPGFIWKQCLINVTPPTP